MTMTMMTMTTTTTLMGWYVPSRSRFLFSRLYASRTIRMRMTYRHRVAVQGVEEEQGVGHRRT
jgi:hypothetical protein